MSDELVHRLITAVGLGLMIGSLIGGWLIFAVYLAPMLTDILRAAEACSP